MKLRIAIVAAFVMLFSMAASTSADAQGRYRYSRHYYAPTRHYYSHYHYRTHYYRPRRVVVVEDRPAWNRHYRPHYRGYNYAHGYRPQRYSGYHRR